MSEYQFALVLEQLDAQAKAAQRQAEALTRIASVLANLHETVAAALLVRRREGTGDHEQ